MDLTRQVTDPVGKIVLRCLEEDDIARDAKDRLGSPQEAVEEITEDFLCYFASRTRIYIFWSLFLLAIILIADNLVDQKIPNQGYGLMIDIYGAVILGRGLLKGPYAIAAETATYVGKSTPARQASIRDLADGLWGVFFLVSGVLLQLVAISI